MTRVGLSVALLAAAAAGPGCQTAVGNYFANRARDFGECWRAQVGLGFGLAAGVRAFGVVDCGIGAGNWHRGVTVGAAYGELYPQDVGGGEAWDYELGILGSFSETAERATVPVGIGARSPGRQAQFRLYRVGVLPALLTARALAEDTAGRAASDTGPSWLNTSLPGTLAWLWSPPPPIRSGTPAPPRMWSSARLHAFDVEAYAFCVFAGARVGFSPGEFVDFLLGWFGVDIAGDDRAYKPPDR